MAHTIIDRVHIAVHGEASPTAGEWTSYLNDIGQRQSEFDVVLVWTLGGGPNATQRDEANRFWRNVRQKKRMAVMTPSLFIRVLATALGPIMGDVIKPFAVTDFLGASAFLRLGPGQADAVRHAVERMAAELERG